MCTYCNTDNYRKIYENHHGPITKDETGRTMEVHHIDGNHLNNNPKNLTLLSINDHYAVHESQNDWDACIAIVNRMLLSSEETSARCRELSLKKVADGTHPFLGGAIQSKSNQERLNNKTHHLLGSEQNLKVLEKGLHPSQRGWCCLKCRRIGFGMTNYYNHQDSKNCEFKYRREILGINLLNVSWICDCGVSGKGQTNFTRHKKGRNCLNNQINTECSKESLLVLGLP